MPFPETEVVILRSNGGFQKIDFGEDLVATLKVATEQEDSLGPLKVEAAQTRRRDMRLRKQTFRKKQGAFCGSLGRYSSSYIPVVRITEP